MKKLILGVALASFVISCKKIQAGSNHGVLKMEEGAERYSNDEMTDAPIEMKSNEQKSTAGLSVNDSAKTTGMQTAPAKMDSAKIVAPTQTSPTLEKK